MNSIEKIIYLIKSNNYSIKDVENIIVEEIKEDRKLLIEEISKIHCYGFEDVSEDFEIKLRKNWNSNNVRF